MSSHKSIDCPVLAKNTAADEAWTTVVGCPGVTKNRAAEEVWTTAVDCPVVAKNRAAEEVWTSALHTKDDQKLASPPELYKDRKLLADDVTDHSKK